MGWNSDRSKYDFVLKSNKNTMHSPGDIPVCIVVCTQPEYEVWGPTNKEKIKLGGWQVVLHNSTPWKVISSRVQLVRYYAASIAKVNLSIDLDMIDSRVPPPGLTYLNPPNSNLSAHYYSGDYVFTETENSSKVETHELRPEMDIEIWMGYVGKFENAESYVTLGADNKKTVDSKKFTKVFNGVIDTVDMKLGRGENPADGVMCVISARDRMRFLIDNKFFGQLNVEGANFKSDLGVDRTQIVKALITQGSSGACKLADDSILFHPSGRTPMVISEPAQNMAVGSTESSTNVLAGIGVPFTIPDQFPVDAIRWFSLVETLPRELYCDVESGGIAWTVRMLGEPYKTSYDGGLFKGYSEFLDIQLSENKESSDLWEGIRKARNRTESTPGFIFSEADAKQLNNLVIDAFKRYVLPTPIYKKILDPVTFCAMISVESDWDPYVSGSLNGMRSNSRGNPVIYVGGKYSDGASGLTQIMLGLHGNGLTTKGFGPDQFQNIQKFPGTNIPLNAKTYIDASLHLLCSFIDETGIKDLVEKNYINPVLAQEMLYEGYNHGQGLLENVLKSALGSINKNPNKLVLSRDYFRKSFIAVVTEYYKNKLGSSYTYNEYYKAMVGRRNAFFRDHYATYLKNNSEIYSSASPGSVVNFVKPENVEVLKGESDPWVLTYKRSIKAEDGTVVKPNVISGHASWSTVGVITRFILINPTVTKSNEGTAGVRMIHSLMGNPAERLAKSGIPGKQETLMQLFRSSAHLPDLSNNIGEDVKNPYLLAATRDPTVDLLNDVTTGGNSSAPVTADIIRDTDISAPLKFLSKIRYPVRNRYVWDESSDARITDAVADLILNSMLSVYGQDIHAADFLVPLNPDMRPGHVVELNNMGYFDGEKLRLEGVIHMFASGGVQNGCTTMGVCVSTQGAQDPIKAAELIADILSIQGSPLNPAQQTNVSEFLEAFVDNAPDICEPIDFSNLFNESVFGSIPVYLNPNSADVFYVVRSFLQNLDKTENTVTSNFINSYSTTMRIPVAGGKTYYTKNQYYAAEQVNYLTCKYALEYLWLSGGDATQDKNYEASSETNNYFSIKTTKGKFEKILNDTVQISSRSPFSEIIKSLKSPDDYSLSSYFSKLRQTKNFQEFLQKNETRIRFRKALGLPIQGCLNNKFLSIPTYFKNQNIATPGFTPSAENIKENLNDYRKQVDSLFLKEKEKLQVNASYSQNPDKTSIFYFLRFLNDSSKKESLLYSDYNIPEKELEKSFYTHAYLMFLYKFKQSEGMSFSEAVTKDSKKYSSAVQIADYLRGKMLGKS